jgi:cytidine deaminase
VSAAPPRPLTGSDLELVAAAAAAIDPVTDDANHTVGAAIRTTDGRTVTGVNLYHFTGGPCAELVVLANLAAAGATPTTIVAVGHHGRGVLSPCGRCRQVLTEYWPEIDVIVPTPGGDGVVPVSALLPWGYRWPGEPAGAVADGPADT